MIVGPRIAESKGSCFVVSKKAPYSTLMELADWMAENPNEIVKVACESGGSSHLAFIGVYHWLKEEFGEDVAGRLKVFVAGSTETKYPVSYTHLDVYKRQHEGYSKAFYTEIYGKVLQIYGNNRGGIPGFRGASLEGKYDSAGGFL